jgi:hypothetical protein
MGVVVLVCGGVGLLLGYLGMQLTKEPPKARVGSGHPIALNKVEDGWTRYRLPEVPMTLDLPTKPVTESLDFDKLSALLYSDWIRYTAESEVTTLGLSAYWYRSRSMMDLDEEAIEAKKAFGQENKMTGVTTTMEDKTIGSYSGEEIAASYTVEGNEAETRMFFFTHGKGVFCVEAHSGKEWHNELVADFERMVKSIVFE